MNGEPGVAVTIGDRIVAVVTLVVDRERIVHLRAAGNPAELGDRRR